MLPEAQNYSPTMFREDWKRWLLLTADDRFRLRASREKFGPHGVRAMVASLAVELGVPDGAVMSNGIWANKKVMRAIYLRKQ